jgi:hypothetical protein
LEYLHRFLSRVFSECGNPSWVLKGGTGMLARVASSRAITDVDLFDQGRTLDAALEELRRLASIDLGDFFRFSYVGHTNAVAGDQQTHVEGYRAYQGLVDHAIEAVDEYLRHAVIKQVKPNPYEIGSTLVRASGMETFKHALHEGYDGLNATLELPFARALDDTGLLWTRNRAQTGYKIPLITLGQTVWFFPDFIVWSGDTILCVDTKAAFIIEPEARRKLLAIQPHRDVSTTIQVKFVTTGTWKTDGTPDSKDGYSVWSLGSGQALQTIPFPDLASVARSFVPDEPH